MNIFIDLDGPILNNLSRLYCLYTHLVQQLGFKPLYENDYWNLKRDNIKEEAILNMSGCYDQQFIQIYNNKRMEDIETRKYLSLNKVTGGCHNALRFLSHHGDLFLITTRRNKDNLMWELREKRLYKYFTDILCDYNDSINPWDIKIELINKFITHVNHDDIIIGDTEAEILCGNKLGLYTIGITNGIRNNEYITALKPNRIVEGIGEIVHIWQDLREDIKNR